jgi:hypothetical protein
MNNTIIIQREALFAWYTVVTFVAATIVTFYNVPGWYVASLIWMLEMKTRYRIL